MPRGFVCKARARGKQARSGSVLCKSVLELVAGFGQRADLARLRCVSRDWRGLRAAWARLELLWTPGAKLVDLVKLLDLCLLSRLEHIDLNYVGLRLDLFQQSLARVVPGLKSLKLMTDGHSLRDLAGFERLERLSLYVTSPLTEPVRFPVPASLLEFELRTEWCLKADTDLVVQSFLEGCEFLQRLELTDVEYRLAHDTLALCAANRSLGLVALSVVTNSGADWPRLLAQSTFREGRSALRLRYFYDDDCDHAFQALATILFELGVCADPSWMFDVEEADVLLQAGRPLLFDYLNPRPYLDRFPEMLAQQKITRCLLDSLWRQDGSLLPWLNVPLDTLEINSQSILVPLELDRVRAKKLVLKGFEVSFSATFRPGELEVLVLQRDSRLGSLPRQSRVKEAAGLVTVSFD